MAASSKGSRKRDKQSISKEHALEILQSALNYVNESGIRSGVTPMYGTRLDSLIIVLENVGIENNNLVVLDDDN